MDTTQKGEDCMGVRKKSWTHLLVPSRDGPHLVWKHPTSGQTSILPSSLRTGLNVFWAYFWSKFSAFLYFSTSPLSSSFCVFSTYSLYPTRKSTARREKVAPRDGLWTTGSNAPRSSRKTEKSLLGETWPTSPLLRSQLCGIQIVHAGLTWKWPCVGLCNGSRFLRVRISCQR